MIIRQLSKNDYENYINLINQLSNTSFSEEKFEYIFDIITKNNNQFIFVIEDDSKLIASWNFKVFPFFGYYLITKGLLMASLDVFIQTVFGRV